MAHRMGHKRTGSIELLEVFGVVNEKGSQNLLPPVHDPLTYDYVLVANNLGDSNSETFRKQVAFVNALKEKKLKIIKMAGVVGDDKVFYGIKADNTIFKKYRKLLKLSDACNWSYEQQGNVPLSTRIRIVNYILNNTYISDPREYLQDLIKKNVFEAEFCLHEKKEQKALIKSWARWTACFQGQPITNVRNYFGEKVALYYLWLGWYTFLLIPAAILGIIVFLYGVAFYQSSPLIKEVCESKIVMCPLCDKTCKVWKLSDTCTYAKMNLLFDNEGTVAFAMFMAVWATVFLEFWKRHRAAYVCEWKVFDWSEEVEELILEIVNNPECEPKQYKHSYLRSVLVMVFVTLMMVLIIGLAHALVVFRVIAAVQLTEYLGDNASIAALMMGAVLHYFTITIMTRVNRLVAIKLCDIERVRTHAGRESSFTVKMFTFQFFTLFSSLIYTAFFLGRINGHPGAYVRIEGKWRLEECHPGGCLTDLFIQMAIIMILKQSINNVFEFAGPWFTRWFKRRKLQRQKWKCANCYIKENQESKPGIELCDNCKLQDVQRNYQLNKVDSFSLFNEFLEMVIQFSFTTIFVAAFPLAPFLALLNNIIEIRLDAIKMVSLERRLVPEKTNNIGVWTGVLEAVGVFAVIANGLVIGISSDFIPRLVYRYYYGPCYNSTAPDVNCMAGYINNTLSIVQVNDTRVIHDFLPNQLMIDNDTSVTHCSYKDYRSSEDYSLTPQFWLILATRLAFVILFEHVVVISMFIAAWFVPSSSLQVKNIRLEERLKRLKEEFTCETNCNGFVDC
ncbi:anoctamin-9 [Clupea harengus]|uniref:Anoctamin n=1 Tax=Clupea harengus TaxID=7950 RepID=A0A6P8F1V1_CLUHA|nr:anoctamin-9 [Clupea harengus]